MKNKVENKVEKKSEKIANKAKLELTNETEIDFGLTIPEVTKVLKGLFKMPYGEVYKLVDKLHAGLAEKYTEVAVNKIEEG